MILKYLYNEIWQKNIVRPINVVYGQLAQIKAVVEFAFIILGYLYIWGYHPSHRMILIIIILSFISCVLIGQWLIKLNIPQRGAELSNELNPLMVKLEKMYEIFIKK